MSQLYRLFTVWNSDLFSIWFFGRLTFFWATLLKFRTTWLRFQATWFWARWLSSDLIDFLQSFPPNISRWWSHDTSRSPSTLIPRVISPSYSSHDHAVVCHECDILPAHDQRTVLKKSCVRCWWVSKCVLWYIIKTGEEQGQFPSRSPEWLTTNNRIFVGHAVHTVIWDRFNATFNVNVKTDVLFR